MAETSSNIPQKANDDGNDAARWRRHNDPILAPPWQEKHRTEMQSAP
jgi:hypothetical protein